MAEYLIAFALVGAVLHRMRGDDGNLWKGISDRYPAALALGAVAFICTDDLLIGAVVAIGYFLFIISGWGSYFIDPEDFDLNKTTGAREKEVAWIDAIISKLPPYQLLQNYAGMTLRGLHAMPLFIGLSVLTGNYLGLINGIWFAVLFGIGYVIFPGIAKLTKWSFDYTSYAEAWAGAALMVLVYITI